MRIRVWMTGKGAAMLCLLAIVCSAAAATAEATERSQQRDLDIPAQPLASALAALARQSGVPITYGSTDLGGRRTSSLNGTYTVEDALARLLSGSGLNFRRTPDGITVEASVDRSVASLSSPRPESAATTLADIVVTATKRAEPQRKLPETVNVIRGKDLEEIGARDMEDFLKYVPGVTLQEGDTSGTRTLSIRGVGPQPQANTTANSTVGTLIDDVSLGDPYLNFLVPDLDPFDLENLEVLKGPQGTLFGAAALNGALRYVLNRPLLGEWEAKAFVDELHLQGAGSGTTFGGAVNVPLGQTLAFRVVDVQQQVPGLYSDVNANGKDIKDADNGYKRMYRIMGLWKPTDRFSAEGFYLSQSNHRNDLSIANNLDDSFTRTDTPGPSSSTQHFSVANLDLRYSFDWATLISETSGTTKLQNLDYDASEGVESLAVEGIQSLRENELVHSRSLTQELRLVSSPGEGPWAWIAGGYFNRYRAVTNQDILLANTASIGTLLGELGLPLDTVVGPDGALVEDTRYDPLHAQEEALFGELTRRLGPVSLTLGGRAYRETLSTIAQLSGVESAAGTLAGFGGAQALKSDGFNPKVSATYQVTRDILGYANASHGFQFGGLNLPSAIPTDNTFPTTYKPSTIWSYESGIRTDAFHKTLELDVTAFLLNWKDLQTQENTPDGISTYTTNVGRARSKGLESSVRWLTPVKGLMLVNSAAYIHAKVAEPFTTSDGTYLAAGSDLPAAPRLQTSTSLVFNTRLGDARTGAGLTFSHLGHAISNLNKSESLEIYRYNTLDFNYHLTFPKLFFAPTITLNATNLTNEHALLGGGRDSIGSETEGELVTYLRPRAIALRLSGYF